MTNKISVIVTKTFTETLELEPSEWVREAMAGNKINAIKALRAAVTIKTPKYNFHGDFSHHEESTMGLKTTKDIIESMFNR